jgi:hypothetical protein
MVCISMPTSMVMVSRTTSMNAMAVNFDSQSIDSGIGSASWMPSNRVSRSRQINSAAYKAATMMKNKVPEPSTACSIR